MKLIGPLVVVAVAAVQAVVVMFAFGAAAIALAVAAATLVTGGALLLAHRRGQRAWEVDQQQRIEQAAAGRVRTRESLILALARLAESRDDDTGEHVDRIVDYVDILAGELKRRGQLPAQVRPQHLRLAAALHDVGKLAIPDEILLKPGMLSDPQRVTMQQHTLIGDRMLEQLDFDIEDDLLITTMRQLVRSHHERWDGGGYPDGLSGRRIPLPARIMAVADVYDALTSRRVYKLAMTHEQAWRIITEASGTQFDPLVVEAFKTRNEAFARISQTQPILQNQPA